MLNKTLLLLAAIAFILPCDAASAQTSSTLQTTSSETNDTVSATSETVSAESGTTATSETASVESATTTTSTVEAGTSDTVTAASQTTPTRTRINYDEIGPGEDATTKPYEEVTATSETPDRDARLLAASVASDFREVGSPKFTFYKNLVPGNERDPDSDDGTRFVSTLETHAGKFGRRPAGPLSGRVIFCSAGHGWTNDNTSTSLWYTQRPNTHGVVEDFGNLDQMNLYADICFRAGATIVPLRPIGFQHVERVIDNVSGHAEFYGSWADSQSTVSFQYDGARVPYRFARAAADETAVARFRPVIPVTADYPVYTWARAGADRVNQTYRVVHAGGVTEVDVDHRRVGNGWVYLGTYKFRRGTSGYVEIPDKVRDEKSVADGGVVIADAIRFGNGMGDVNRGGGISGYPREEEASRYWAESSLDKDVPALYNAYVDRADQSNNVGTAPRFSAYMNRETDGDFFDRLFMSFHSNAAGGRGVVGLYNSHARLRPDHQIELAKLAADELNNEMTSAGIQLLRPWHVRPMRTDGHINFGEIRRDYLNNEMSATIVEVAYHDNKDDAALLRQLSIRRAVALSSYRATLRYFREVGGADINYYAPPSPPQLLAVTHGTSSGTINIKWSPAEQDPLSSQSEEITYRIYRSSDGVAFDQGTDVGKQTEYSLTKIKELQPVYARVTAVSPGGESLPSAVLGASLSADKPALIVQGAPTAADDTVLSQTAERNLGWALRPGGSFARLVPHVMNNGEQVRAVGTALRTLSRGFESVDAGHTALARPFIDYNAVAIMLGREPVAEAFTTTDTIESLHDYVTSGGRILVSGGRLAEVDTPTTAGLVRWGEFSEQVLRVAYGKQTSVTQLLKTGGQDLTTTTLQIGDRALRYFEPRPTEVLAPENAGHAVLAYENTPGAAAVATINDGAICTAVLGFPLEELASRNAQAVLAAQIFVGMGLKAKEAPKPPVKSKGAANDDQSTSTSAADHTTTAAEAVTTGTE